MLKPAEDTPSTAVELGRLALSAGFPAGMLNVVTGLGTGAGASLAAHTGIDHIAFTGSRPVGSSIAMAAAQNIVPVVLELGGKSPNIVFADADLDVAVPLIVNAITQNAGQTCSAGSRLLVHRSIQQRVIGRIAEQFERLELAPGLSDADMGPLINARQRDRVSSLVEAGRHQATLVVGGYAPTEAALTDGFFFRPTLFDETDPASVLAQEEIFGPVLVATGFDTDDEAVELANGTRYGLVAALWTRDVGRAHRIAEQVVAGQVFINTYGAAGGVQLPFGGWKRSGYGREKGFEALIGYTQTKTIAIGI